MNIVFPHVLAAGVLVDIADVMDRAAHGVQQRRAATGEILLLRHGRHLFQRQAVVDDHASLSNSTVETSASPASFFCLAIMELKPMVSASSPARALPDPDKNQFCHNETLLRLITRLL